MSKCSPSEMERSYKNLLTADCFIESVHEKYQWKAHQPPKAPSMGVILVKNPCYSDEKIKQ